MVYKLKYYTLLLLLTIIFPKLYQDAPNFYLRDINNIDYFLSDYVQKETVVLSFFATWCEPCRQELPLLDSLANINKEVSYIYVATGSEHKPLKKSPIKQFISELNLKETILLDKYGRTFNKYSTNGMLPLTVVINDSQIIYYSEKFDKETSIKQLTEIISTIKND